MANISTAIGSITFDDDFYATNKDLIDQALADIVATNGDYGFASFKHSRDGEFDFTGYGRWNFENALHNMCQPSWWTPTNIVTVAMQRFYNMLCNSDQTIAIFFTDSECGCEFLYTQDGIIYADKDHHLRYAVSCENYVEYTLPNLIAYDVREGYTINNNNINNFINDNDLPISRRNDILKMIKTNDFLQGYVDTDYDEAYQIICDELGIAPQF